MISAGDFVPSIRLPATSGGEVDLAKAAEKHHLVLFLYPGDGAGLTYPELAGCTAQACGFRDAITQFRQKGALVFGVSLQPTERQRQFVQREHLPFDLLSDQAEEFVRALAVPVWESPQGERYATRTTVVVAKGGQIARLYRNVQVEGHVTDVLEALQTLWA